MRVPLTPVSAQDTKERKPQAPPWGLAVQQDRRMSDGPLRTPHPRAGGSDREPGAVGLGGEWLWRASEKRPPTSGP